MCKKTQIKSCLYLLLTAYYQGIKIVKWMKKKNIFTSKGNFRSPIHCLNTNGIWSPSTDIEVHVINMFCVGRKQSYYSQLWELTLALESLFPEAPETEKISQDDDTFKFHSPSCFNDERYTVHIAYTKHNTHKIYLAVYINVQLHGHIAKICVAY